MEDVWKERALAAAERGWEAMERLLAAIFAMSSAERAPRLEADALILRGLKRAIQAKLRVAEALARRLFFALALDMGARASERAALADEPAPDPRPDEPGRPQTDRAAPDRAPPFALFEPMLRLEDIWRARPQRPAREPQAPLPESDLVPARHLKARLAALNAAIADPLGAARRLIAEIQRRRHAGKLHNLKLGWPPGVSQHTDPEAREPIMWLNDCVQQWACERHHASLAPG
ncbi:hypothetical protein WNY37_17240 [Henriciella sp. AS95]|uniref:hypothetical protein n=1 Tax=Henriciella sp. AS95 TaxID=3135782 RepID=UPI00317FF76A